MNFQDKTKRQQQGVFDYGMMTVSISATELERRVENLHEKSPELEKPKKNPDFVYKMTDETPLTKIAEEDSDDSATQVELALQKYDSMYQCRSRGHSLSSNVD